MINITEDPDLCSPFAWFAYNIFTFIQRKIACFYYD